MINKKQPFSSHSLMVYLSISTKKTPLYKVKIQITFWCMNQQNANLKWTYRVLRNTESIFWNPLPIHVVQSHSNVNFALMLRFKSVQQNS